jgi:glutaconate CoA-transferase subunit B
VIGDHEAGALPGPACQIAAMCRETFVMLVRATRSSSSSISADHSGDGVMAPSPIWGPERVDGELTLAELHRDVAVEDVQEATGWDLRVAPDVRRGPPPTAEELEALRALTPANEDTVRS